MQGLTLEGYFYMYMLKGGNVCVHRKSDCNTWTYTHITEKDNHDPVCNSHKHDAELASLQ